MACTLRALWLYESHTGTPVCDVEDPESFRVFLWALLQTDQPSIEQGQVNGLVVSFASYFAAIRDAAEICRTSTPPEGLPNDPSSPGGQIVPLQKATETDWYNLWSWGRVHCRMTEEEFWSLTPRMFAALCDRYDEDYEGFAALEAQFYNAHRGENQAPLKGEIFMRGRRGDVARRRMIWERGEALRQRFVNAEEVVPGKRVATPPAILQQIEALKAQGKIFVH